MSNSNFYATSAEGTVHITDNYGFAEKQGEELFIEVSSEPNIPLAPYGLLLEYGDSSGASAIGKDDARRLRDFLNGWIGDE